MREIREEYDSAEPCAGAVSITPSVDHLPYPQSLQPIPLHFSRNFPARCGALFAAVRYVVMKLGG